MKVTAELENIFTARSEDLSKVEITYQNGGRVTGIVKSVHPVPLAVVIQKSIVSKRENPQHKIVFDHVTGIVITFKDHTIKKFK